MSNYLLILLIIAVAPVILIAKYLYKMDIDKEPMSVIKKIFIISMVSAMLGALPVELIMDKIILQYDEITTMLIYVYGVGLVEELFKFLPGYLFGIKSSYYNSFYDAILYCAISALGFACIENIIYVFNYGIIVAILRAVLSIPGHTLYGAILGVFVGFATAKKQEDKQSSSIFYIIIGLLIASYIHGLYDYVLTSGNFIMIAITLIVEIFLMIYTIKIIKKLSKINSFQVDTKEYLKYIIVVLVTTIAEISLIMILTNNVTTSFSYSDGKYNINEQFETEDFTVKVNSVDQVIKSNETYIKVNLSLKNNSDKELGESTNYSFGIKERGSDTVVNNEMFLILEDGELPLTISSGEEKNGDIYFKTDATDNLRLVIADCYSIIDECSSYVVNLN